MCVDCQPLFTVADNKWQSNRAEKKRINDILNETHNLTHIY